MPFFAVGGHLPVYADAVLEAANVDEAIRLLRAKTSQLTIYNVENTPQDTFAWDGETPELLDEPNAEAVIADNSPETLTCCVCQLPVEHTLVAESLHLVDGLTCETCENVAHEACADVGDNEMFFCDDCARIGDHQYMAT